MSGRSSRGAGWDRPSTPPWVYALVGVLLTLAVVLAIVVFMLLGNGNPGLASATSTPTLPPAGATPTAAASAVAAATAAPTAEASTAPTAAPVVTPAPTAAETPAPGSPGPSGSPKPTLTSFKGPHTASCNGDNGASLPGYIHLTWTSTDTTGVRLAIDYPNPADGYANPYSDYPSSGSADVPFSCDTTLTDATGAYHLYTLITQHTTGYYQYRFIKVYLIA